MVSCPAVTSSHPFGCAISIRVLARPCSHRIGRVCFGEAAPAVVETPVRFVEDRGMEIRQLRHDERLKISLPIEAYCFQPSPATPGTINKLQTAQPYYVDHVTLVAEEDGAAVAEASAIPMLQNVRGSRYRMAGIAGVSTQPLARRRGHVRALLNELLGRLREEGYTVSALYPFRPSFYEKFGYVGVPKTRMVRFAPADLDFLLHAELDGEVTLEEVGTGFDAYREFTQRLLAQRHGFALLPEHQDARLRDTNERWLAMARVGGDVVGAITYSISGHGGELIADDLLTTSSLGRALLLQFFARHVDHVSTISMIIPPEEIPELWATDLAAVTETRISFPTSPAPMARVLSLDGLHGMPVGAGRVNIEVVEDPFLRGRYVLDGMDGALEVIRSTTISPTVTLTAAGLSGLVYGVLDPGDVVVRGLGEVPFETVSELSKLLPRLLPYFFSRF
jgi:predicted acetyltransferase